MKNIFYSLITTVALSILLNTKATAQPYLSSNGISHSNKLSNNEEKVNELNIERVGSMLVITSEIPKGIQEVELRISSSRNENISRYTDTSPSDPEPRDYNYSWEAWYPVVDIGLTPEVEGVAKFRTAEPGHYSINGKYYHQKFPVEEQVVIPANLLEFWANELYVEPKTNVLDAFYLRQRIPVTPGVFRHTVALLAEDWAGSISLYDISSQNVRKIAESSIDAPTIVLSKELEKLQDKGLDKSRLLASLEAVVSYTLKSRNQQVTSPTANGLYLFYDLHSQTYRRPDWIWPWGVGIKLLLQASAVPELSSRFAPADIQEAAYEMGKASLEFIECNPQHPAYGISTSRFGETRSGFGNTYGYTEYINPADALFLAGWGWIPLFQQTGDSTFLSATRQMAQSVNKLVHSFDLVPMDYVEEEGQWKDFTLNEHGFGMEGLAELYAVDPSPEVRKFGYDYIEQVLDKLGRTDGLWERRYNRNTGEIPKRGYREVVKGQGWAMEGLLAAHRMMPEERYLNLATKMAEHLIESQLPSGSWPFRFTHTVEEDGVAEKGTALWSLLLYRLYNATGNDKHLNAARKALQWCLDNQYTGPDPHAYGGIVGDGRRSGINFRFWYPMTCSYAASFFGLAIIEELQLK